MAVSNWWESSDTILTSYLNDMGKYNNLNEIKKTRLAYDNITVQLSKKNTMTTLLPASSG